MLRSGTTLAVSISDWPIFSRPAGRTQRRLWDPCRPRTCNNLALLELGRLNSVEAERWVTRGLACKPLHPDDQDLLQATACDLRLFQLRPDAALAHVEQQLVRRESVMALANKAVCLHKLARLPEAVVAQERAIQIHLAQHAPSLRDVPLVNLVGQPCADLKSSMQLQTQLLNLALYRLSLDAQDSVGLRLSLAGTSNDEDFWQDTRRRQTLWDGSFCDQLILWDDQGFGDTLQNLGWIAETASRVGSLRICLRPALLPLVSACLSLPANCHLEALHPQSSPWAEGGFTDWFLFPSHSSQAMVASSFTPVVLICGCLRCKVSISVKRIEEEAHWPGLECRAP